MLNFFKFFKKLHFFFKKSFWGRNRKTKNSKKLTFFIKFHLLVVVLQQKHKLTFTLLGAFNNLFIINKKYFLIY